MMPFNKTQDRQFSLLGICSGLGQTKRGLELGPDLLRAHGITEMLGENISDLGNITPAEDHSNPVWDLVSRVRSKAIEALKNGDRLLSIGGDHSVSIGTVQATLQTYPEARVVWIDAHGDINTPATSLTGSLHGMPLAALMGLFHCPIGGARLLPENLLIIGVRDLDSAEKIFFDDLQIEFIPCGDILEKPRESMEKVREWLQRDRNHPIHLSLDIDALDPSLAPATGIRVPLGLTVGFSKELVELIASTEQIISIDIMEFNPLMAQNQNELDQTIAITKSVFNAAVSNLLPPEALQ